MLTSPDNLWSPDPTDPVNMTVHWAESMQSVQDALSSRKQGYQAMTDAQRLALAGANLFNGLVVYTTDTKVLWRYTTSWSLFGFGTFRTQTVESNASGTVTAVGTMGAMSSISASTSISSGSACRARITLSFQASIGAANSGFAAGVAATGATTFTPVRDTAKTIQVSSASTASNLNTFSGSWLMDISPGTTTLSVVAQATGAGSIRTISRICLIVEPVSE